MTATQLKHTSTTAGAWTPRRVSQELHSVLQDLTRIYQQLSQHLVHHRDAVRSADPVRIARCNEDQTTLIESIEQAERHRREVVARACSVFPDLGAKARATTPTVSMVIECIDEKDRSICATLADDLRHLIQQVRTQTATIRAASVQLVSNLEALMQQVGQRLSHSGTYSRKGNIQSSGVVMTALDVRT